MVITELFCNFRFDKKRLIENNSTITRNKITGIFCTVDEFSKKFDAEMAERVQIMQYG